MKSLNLLCLLAAVGHVSAGLKPRANNAGNLLALRPASSQKKEANARVSDKASNHSMAVAVDERSLDGLNLFARQDDGCRVGSCKSTSLLPLFSLTMTGDGWR